MTSQIKLELPEGAIGRFAIVKLWPEFKTAEDECIARITIAAQTLGLECIEINADGSFRNTPNQIVDRRNVDFVIHLHYDTPKRYDALSFVALWNPIAFYHQWDYARCSRNLTSHDDFLSCGSNAADDHVARMLRGQPTHLPARYKLYHSIASLTHAPSLGDHKLFYAGINWEHIGVNPLRHQEVLKRLDKTGLLRIYGPQLFQGVQVWKGYDSYVREIPFDGFSMIEEISRAGIALVLSSEAHKDSELMSNRLFESVSAGALIICDENPFAKRFFGDSLLYIDCRSSVEQMYSDILRHMDWADKNPAAALELIKKAQRIFAERFTLIGNLTDLYSGLEVRRKQLSDLQHPPSTVPPTIALNLLLPEFSALALQSHLQSIAVQDYRTFSPVLVLDVEDAAINRAVIEAAISASPIPVSLKTVQFFGSAIPGSSGPPRRLGEIMLEIINDERADSIVIVAPNEKLFSNHLSVLAGALQRDPNVNCAATAAILLNGNAPVHAVHELIDFGGINPSGPPGFGRFIFRTNGIPEDIDLALPYLDVRPIAVLVGDNKIKQLLPVTLNIDLQSNFRNVSINERYETEIIRDFSPGAFDIAAGFCVPKTNAVPASTVSLRELFGRLFHRGWLTYQLRAIRKDGLAARLAKLNKKIKARFAGGAI